MSTVTRFLKKKFDLKPFTSSDDKKGTFYMRWDISPRRDVSPNLGFT